MTPEQLTTRFLMTGEQLFFIADARTATVYRGNSLGNGYRFTHGIMAHAFAVLARERNIKTFVLSQGPRGGLRLHMSETLRVHGHELSGNYDVSREEVDRTIPMDIRIRVSTLRSSGIAANRWCRRGRASHITGALSYHK